SLSEKGLAPNPRIELAYPISTLYNQRLNIQPHFFGIEFGEEESRDAENSTAVALAKSNPKIVSAKMLALQLRAERKEGWTTQMVKDFELSITQFFEREYNSPTVRVLTLSTSYVEIEFSLAIMACICPFMACGTALGGLFFLGVRFGSILCVTPFLVLAIDSSKAMPTYPVGVDDAYLMIHSWQRVTKELRENPVKGDSAAYRLAQKSISSLRDRFTDGFNGLLDKYVSMITNQLFDVFIVIVWLIFLATSIKGITQMPINLTPKKLFSLDSSLQEMDVLRVNYVIPHFTLATLFVNKPGNLSDPSRLARLNQFVNEMESLPGAWGSKSSNYFIRDFVEFEKGMSEMEAEEEDAVVTRDPNVLNFNDLPSFLEWPEY
ncbi:unnamed protein product, partial [Nippostrongylus brasiliensis]|uniref:SSD domain-containing protein n=1 Tax=Nippostrongylus brasiliensis TaxID=27835 RepID=A0A0N4YX41_NIPBR